MAPDGEDSFRRMRLPWYASRREGRMIPFGTIKPAVITWLTLH